MILILFLALIAAVVPALLFLRNLRAYAPPIDWLDRRGNRPAQLTTDAAGTQAVSVLIPARNEARCIHQAISAALAQEGVVQEVVVLDDQSTDDTASIVQAWAARDPRVRLEHGPSLPPGWSGKNHACHRLAELARHNWLVFVDADVELQPGALRRMVTFMQATDSDLASGVPSQVLVTFSEKLLIPLIHFVLLGFLPIHRMRRSLHPAYAAGCGQLLIARAEAYRAAGGHAAIRASLHDGLSLPRAFRLQGLRTDLFDATPLAKCRMYTTEREVWAGLGKNACEGIGAPARIVPFTLLLGAGQVLPFVLLPFAAFHSKTATILALSAATLAWLPRLLALRRFRQPPESAWLHPIGVLGLLGIQWLALAKSRAGQPAQWKGRAYSPGSVDPGTRRPDSGRKPAGTLVQSVLLAMMSCSLPLKAGEHPKQQEALVAPGSTNTVPHAVGSPPPRLLSSFTLRDQYDETRRIEFPRTRVCVLFVADQRGSKQLESWIRPLHARYGDRIDLEGIADVSAVPAALRGVVRSAFRRQFARTVMLD